MHYLEGRKRVSYHMKLLKKTLSKICIYFVIYQAGDRYMYILRAQIFYVSNP